MSMVLRNKELINGVSPKMAKQICRKCSRSFYTSADLAREFEVTEVAMAQWMLLLDEAGFVYMHPGRDGDIRWGSTADGIQRLAHARLGKPLSGSEYADLIFTVMARIGSYNADQHHPFLINEAYLFGPILTQPWLDDDPDIIIVTEVKPEVAKEFNWRSDYYYDFGSGKASSILDRLFYADHELATYLHKQREHLNLCVTEDMLPDGCRLIYRREGFVSDDPASSDAVMSREKINGFAKTIDSYRKGKPSTRSGHSGKSAFRRLAEYWKDKEQFKKLGISFEDASESCWRCGSRRDLQRCHIVPSSLGGIDEESNYVILCARCHAEGPNIIDDSFMFDWIASYRSRYGEEYWTKAALAEYERIYGKSVYDEIDSILAESGSTMSREEALSKLRLVANEASTRAIYHFGQTWFNDATMAGLYRMALKQLPKHV